MFPSTKYKAKLVSSTSPSQWDATRGSHFHPLLLHLTEGKSSPVGRACWGWAQHQAGLRVPWEQGGEQPPKPPTQLQGPGCAGQSPGPGLALGLDPGQDGERGLLLSPGTSCDNAGLSFSQNEKRCITRRNILAKLYCFSGGGVFLRAGKLPTESGDPSPPLLSESRFFTDRCWWEIHQQRFLIFCWAFFLENIRYVTDTYALKVITNNIFHYFPNTLHGWVKAPYSISKAKHSSVHLNPLQIASSVTLERHVLHPLLSRMGGTVALATDWEAPAVNDIWDQPFASRTRWAAWWLSPSPATHRTSFISNRHHCAEIYTNKNSTLFYRMLHS